MATTAKQWGDAFSTELVAQVPEVERRKRPEIRERAVEIDIWIDSSSLADVGTFLGARSFVPMRSIREGSHRFFVSKQPWGWGKVDAKLKDGRERAFANWLWALRRRRGPIIALVGADGAGKSSAMESLDRTTPFGTHVAYLGSRRRKRKSSIGSQPAPRSSAREVVGVGVWLVRSARRLLPIHLQARLGRVVICDRHPIEIAAVDGAPSPAARALRRFIAGRVLPAPDHLFLLAAPGDVLYARKGEHSPERLDEMTAAFRRLVEQRGGSEIDATQPPESVVGAIETVLLELIAARS